MSKNRVRLTICGTECAIASEDSENYIRSIGDEVEKAIQEITDKNSRVSLTMAAIIAALGFCDESHRASAAADNLRSQIKDYLEDSSRARLETEESRREVERLKKEIQSLRAKLNAETKSATSEPEAAAPQAKPNVQETSSVQEKPAEHQEHAEKPAATESHGTIPKEPSAPAKPAAPVHRTNGEGPFSGNYTRTRQAPSQAEQMVDADGFMSFFAKEGSN